METGETGETLFFIVLVMRELGCGKKRQIFEIFKKCYFFIHFPILELRQMHCRFPRLASCEKPAGAP